MRPTIGLVSVCLLSIGPVSAIIASSVDADSVSVQAGADGRVSVSASTDQPLSVLSVDLLFDPELCSMISGQALVATGRSDSATGPQSGGLGCPSEGRVRIVFFNLGGGAAIPAGDGPIAEWQFEALPGATGGVFPLSIVVNVAQNGPSDVPISAGSGDVTIVASPSDAVPAPAFGAIGLGALALLLVTLGAVGIKRGHTGERVFTTS